MKKRLWPRLRRSSRIFLFLLPVIAAVAAAQSTTKPDKNIWDGVYSSAQAARGRDTFDNTCSRCHMADLSGGENPPLKGGVFLGHWLEDSLNPLFMKMNKMPPRGDKLSEAQYLDVLSYVLQTNGFPEGQADLKANVLERILVTRKDGPGPVPDFALVQTVGCLSETPDGWVLSKSSEPMRSRNPDKPTDDEFKQASAQVLGTHTFLLLSPGSFKSGFHIDEHKGEKMQGKGLLIRTAKDERLNVTWLETLSKTCP